MSLSESTDEAIRAAADAAGLPVSTWIAQAAERAAAEQAKLADGLAAVQEYEHENGVLDPAAVDRAAAELMGAGVFGARPAAG